MAFRLFDAAVVDVLDKGEVLLLAGADVRAARGGARCAEAVDELDEDEGLLSTTEVRAAGCGPTCVFLAATCRGRTVTPTPDAIDAELPCENRIIDICFGPSLGGLPEGRFTGLLQVLMDVPIVR